MKIFYHVFNKSKAFVTVFNSSAILKVCTTARFGKILRHVEVSFLTLNENQSTSFSMMRVFTEGCIRADVHLSLNFNVDITVVSYMKNNSGEMKLHNFSKQWINLIISRTIEPETTCKVALFETYPLILLYFTFFFYLLLKHKQAYGWHISCLFLFFFRYTFICLPIKKHTWK